MLPSDSKDFDFYVGFYMLGALNSLSFAWIFESFLFNEPEFTKKMPVVS